MSISQNFIYQLRKLSPEAICYQTKMEGELIWLEYHYNLRFDCMGMDFKDFTKTLATLGKVKDNFLDIYLLKTTLPLGFKMKSSWDEEFVLFNLTFELSIKTETLPEEVTELVDIVFKELASLKSNLEEIIKKATKISS